MNIETTLSEIEEKTALLMHVIDEKNKRIQQLENGLAKLNIDNCTVFIYITKFRDFLCEAEKQNFKIERKNSNERTRGFVDIDYNWYKQFSSENFDKVTTEDFKSFLVDMCLVESEMLSKPVLAGAGQDRRRVFRIKASVFNRLTSELSTLLPEKMNEADE